MKRSFILLSHFVVVKDFEFDFDLKHKSYSKCSINTGIPQNFLVIFFALNEQKKLNKAV